MLHEEAGILSQLRKGILPRPCQSPSNAQFVLRDGGAIQADKKRERRHCEPETKPDHFPSSTRCREAIRSTKAARAYHAQTLALMKDVRPAENRDLLGGWRRERNWKRTFSSYRRANCCQALGGSVAQTLKMLGHQLRCAAGSPG